MLQGDHMPKLFCQILRSHYMLTIIYSYNEKVFLSARHCS
jgi:hypothetical protein